MFGKAGVFFLLFIAYINSHFSVESKKFALVQWNDLDLRQRYLLCIINNVGLRKHLYAGVANLREIIESQVFW